MRLPNCRAIVDLDFLFWTTGSTIQHNLSKSVSVGRAGFRSFKHREDLYTRLGQPELRVTRA